MAPVDPSAFPLPLDAYTGEEGLRLVEILARRAAADPLNLVATGLFLAAILHTFMAPALMARSHRLRHAGEAALGPGAHSARVRLFDSHHSGEFHRLSPAPVWTAKP
jgi:hypothetical protein